MNWIVLFHIVDSARRHLFLVSPLPRSTIYLIRTWQSNYGRCLSLPFPAIETKFAESNKNWQGAVSNWGCILSFLLDLTSALDRTTILAPPRFSTWKSHLTTLMGKFYLNNFCVAEADWKRMLFDSHLYKQGVFFFALFSFCYLLFFLCVLCCSKVYGSYYAPQILPFIFGY